MPDIVKCKGKCLHEIKELEKTEAIRDGNSYYHPDCFKAKQDALEIINIWSKKVNPLCNFAQLRRAVNNIIYDKKVDSGMLLYGLKMYIDKKIPLHYPGGLYYIIQNHEVQEKYKEMQARKMREVAAQNVADDEGVDFTFKHIKEKGLGDIFDD